MPYRLLGPRLRDRVGPLLAGGGGGDDRLVLGGGLLGRGAGSGELCRGGGLLSRGGELWRDGGDASRRGGGLETGRMPALASRVVASSRGILRDEVGGRYTGRSSPRSWTSGVGAGSVDRVPTALSDVGRRLRERSVWVGAGGGADDRLGGVAVDGGRFSVAGGGDPPRLRVVTVLPPTEVDVGRGIGSLNRRPIPVAGASPPCGTRARVP
ncbi:MAG: hypothetical protein ABI542_01235 [Gemmatimonadota bacterium]